MLAIRTVAILAMLGASASVSRAQWPQWGGPGRDFKSQETGLADAWPEDGPRRIWSRELGEGYSAVSVVDGVLYTMRRIASEESVIALDAVDGKTRWEQKWSAPIAEGMRVQFGEGPHCTPLIVGGRVFAVGVLEKLVCLDAKDGREIWSHDLKTEFDATQLPRGYACSPIAYKNMVIVTGGGDDQAVLAFRRSDGELMWASQTYVASYSSPILIEIAGRKQLVVLMGAEIAGLDPETGKRLWQHEHRTNMYVNVATPIFDGKDTLFVSSAYGMGARAIRIRRTEGGFETQELWHNTAFQIHHGNAILIGEAVYGSSGSFGPAFFTAINLYSGEIAWKKRGYAKATSLLADGKLIFVDEAGVLGLARVTPEEMTVVSEAQLFDERAWTVPTLADKVLYLRSQKRLMALDLARHKETPP